MSKTNMDRLLAIKNYAEKLLRFYPKNPNTRDEYKTIFERVRKYSGYDIVRYAEDKMLSKRSFYKYKAAVQYGLAEKIQECTNDESERHIEKVEELFAFLKNLNPAVVEMPDIKTWPDSQSLYPEEKIRQKYRRQGKPKRKLGRQQRAGKRRSIIGLPDDWMIEVCKHVPLEYSSLTLILALTGCRPSELAKGIRIGIDQNGQLECTIHGAKFSKTKGHGQRTLVFDPEINDFAKIFQAAFEKEGIKSRIFSLPNGSTVNDIRRFGDKIRYAAQNRIGFKKVSPYSFRHQFASNLRNAGLSEIDIAMAMGHRTTRMRKHYGLKSYGKAGGFGLVYVDASEKNLIRTTYFEHPPLNVGESNDPQLDM